MPSLPLADDFSVTWPCRNTLLRFYYKTRQDNISQSKYLIYLCWMYQKIHISISNCWNTHLEKYWKCPHKDDTGGLDSVLSVPCRKHDGVLQGQNLNLSCILMTRSWHDLQTTPVACRWLVATINHSPLSHLCNYSLDIWCIVFTINSEMFFFFLAY